MSMAIVRGGRLEAVRNRLPIEYVVSFYLLRRVMMVFTKWVLASV